MTVPTWTWLLREVDELDGTGLLPDLSRGPAIDAAMDAGFVELATPRGFYLTDAGRAALAPRAEREGS